MPRIGGFQSFHTARRTIRGFEAMLWLRKGFDFAGAWTVCEQNRLLSVCFGFPAGQQSVKLGSVQPIVRPTPEFATGPPEIAPEAAGRDYRFFVFWRASIVSASRLPVIAR